MSRPSYVEPLPLAAEALQFLAERRADDPHALAVGALLHDFGYPQRVVMAGLLHATIGTSVSDFVELRLHFGPAVAGLVEAVTEDRAVAHPAERRARLRRQVASAGSRAAAVFAADKLLRVREIRERAAREPGFEPDAEVREELEAYDASRRLLERELGDHPLVQALAAELAALDA
jgi:(p)ppGpp synthase/HD superfamily hydrolase